jgi:hypothetical protein
MGAEAILRPDSFPVYPGGEAHSEISVRNTGQVVDSFALSVIGDAAAWAMCEPPVLSLFPGQSAAAHVIVRPPLGPHVPHGPLPFAVRVTSSEDPVGSVVEEGLLDIGPVPVVTADLEPRTGRSRGLRPSRHKVIVGNHGNAPASVELIGGDDADMVFVQVTPPGLMVPPGATATARVRVRARRRFWRGAKESHPFHVVASPPDGVLQRCDGTMIQVAVLPSWLFRAFALALAGAVAVAALWFGLVRPAVSAGGGSSTSPPVSPSVKVSPSKSASGKTSTSPPAKGKSSPATTSTSPAANTTSKPPAPVDAMTVLSTGSASLAEPAKQRLAITDLVIQDPAGDNGILSLTLDGKLIYTEQLADFPDYDVHFLTPIMLRAGQTLQMTVNCSNSGGKACSPLVLLTGMNSST